MYSTSCRVKCDDKCDVIVILMAYFDKQSKLNEINYIKLSLLKPVSLPNSAGYSMCNVITE